MMSAAQVQQTENRRGSFNEINTRESHPAMRVRNRRASTGSSLRNIFGGLSNNNKKQENINNISSRFLVSHTQSSTRRSSIGSTTSSTVTTGFSISTYYNLAEEMCSHGEWKEALDLYLEVLRLQKQKFGLMHPRCARTLNDIAVAYSHMGPKYHMQALSSFRDALQIQLTRYNSKKKDETVSEEEMAHYEKEVAITARNMQILMDDSLLR